MPLRRLLGKGGVGKLGFLLCGRVTYWGHAQGTDLLATYRMALQNDLTILEADANHRAAMESKPQAISQLLPPLNAVRRRLEWRRFVHRAARWQVFACHRKRICGTPTGRVLLPTVPARVLLSGGLSFFSVRAASGASPRRPPSHSRLQWPRLPCRSECKYTSRHRMASHARFP
jgi:hypothetical protein